MFWPRTSQLSSTTQCTKWGIICLLVRHSHPQKETGSNPSYRQCAGESPTCIRTLITGGQSDVDLDIGPLNFVCEEGSIDNATSQLYPSAARLDMPTFILSTTVVTETITAARDELETRKAHVVTLTDTVVVEKTNIPSLLPALSHLYPTFTPSPLTPTTCQTSTPTPSKISIGTVGTGGLPKATMGKLSTLLWICC
jgi:hypothetical protein